ncbi:MAG TPA: tetratricopeptide repeat protein [Blastocatellia bacterium]|nr:tetratricopeptide repeat protein [Blastocatellia bacterium]
MNIREILYRLTGGRASSRRLKQCPQETDLLDYTEGRLPAEKQALLESHFTGCKDCREFLALYAQLSEEGSQVITPLPEPISDEAVKEQTARILTLIKEDEYNQRKQKFPARRAGFLSYAGVAAAVVLAVAAALYLTREPSREDAAMQALAKALKNERRIEPRISGGFAWSRYSNVRGEGEDDRLALGQAIDELKFAEAESAPASSRLLLARASLASGERERAEKALKILRELAASGNRSAAVLNDMGVAMFQLGYYREAVPVLDEALEKDPNYEQALFNRALANYRAQLTDEARKDFTRFLEGPFDEKWKDEARRHLDMLNRSSAP